MSLPDELWDVLQLDRAVVRGRAQFFAAYAGLDDSYGLRDLVDLVRRDPRSVDGIPGVELMYPSDDLRAASAWPGVTRSAAPWVRVAEAADAWRQSAVAELIVDLDVGRSALSQAATDYRRLGLPFGDFLAAVVRRSPEEARRAARRLRFLLLGDPNPDQGAVAGLLGQHTVLAAPAQQIALLLTACSHPRAVSLDEETLAAVDSAPQGAGSRSVGTTSEPIATWWRAGRLLFELGQGSGEARDDLAALLADLGRAHGRQLARAQLDVHHWTSGHARVDLVDLDLAGLVALSSRVLRDTDRTGWGIDDFTALPALGRISLTVGVQLGAGGGGPRPNSPAPDPRSPDPVGPGRRRQSRVNRPRT